MTEAEWLASEEPQAMAAFATQSDARRARLFACACCRLLRPLLADRRSRDAVETTELHAVGRATDAELAAAADRALAARKRTQERWQKLTTGPDTSQARLARTGAFGRDLAAHVAHTVAAAGYYTGLVGHVISANGFERYSKSGAHPGVAPGMLAALRDIFNPFHPVALDPAWLTSTVTQLAGGIYEERAFDRLPILADALMDAGCDNERVMEHCKSSGTHIRGCWVVDMLLVKA